MSTSSYELLHEAIERRLDHLQILMTCCTSTTGPDLKPLAGSGRLEVQLDQAERRLHHLNDLIQSQDRYIQRLRQIRSVLGHDDRPDGGELKKLGSTAAVVISAADFAKLPADRRRMTTSLELNQFYNRLQGRLRNKYDLLLKPRSALTSQELIEAVRYERQEQLPMTRGHRFLCMDDDPDADRTGALIEALIDLGTVHRIPGTSPACYTLIRLESA